MYVVSRSTAIRFRCPVEKRGQIKPSMEKKKKKTGWNRWTNCQYECLFWCNCPEAALRTQFCMISSTLFTCVIVDGRKLCTALHPPPRQQKHLHLPVSIFHWLHLVQLTCVQEELAVSYRWTDWVCQITGFSPTSFGPADLSRKNLPLVTDEWMEFDV